MPDNQYNQKEECEHNCIERTDIVAKIEYKENDYWIIRITDYKCLDCNKALEPDENPRINLLEAIIKNLTKK